MIITLLLMPLSALATTYYVSNSGGNDSNNGTSSTTPWQTLGHLQTVHFNPGDTILLKRGDVWYEQLNTTSSGTSVSPITYEDYGTGAFPQINGGYYYPYGALIQNNYITLNNLDLEFASNTDLTASEVYMSSTIGTILTNLNVENGFGQGIAGLYATDTYIGYCTVKNVGNRGIYLAFSDNALIEHNDVSLHGILSTDSEGIGLIVPTGPNIIRYNTVHDGQVVASTSLPNIGIRFDGNGGEGTPYQNTDQPGNVAYRNLIWNEGLGYQSINFSHDAFYNNTIWYSQVAAATIATQPGYGISDYDQFYNNIVGGDVYAFDMEALGNYGAYINNNLYYPGDGLQRFVFSSDPNWTLEEIFPSITFSQYQATSTFDSNSLSTDPLFIQSSSTDIDFPYTYNLTGDSPAIDAGTSTPSLIDFLGNPVIGTPDIGAFEYQKGSLKMVNIKGDTILNGQNIIR